jgi:hypothetical protein
MDAALANCAVQTFRSGKLFTPWLKEVQVTQKW